MPTEPDIWGIELNKTHSRLHSAEMRILELELAESRLIRELSNARHSIINQFKEVTDGLNIDNIYPSYKIALISNGLTIVQRRDLWLRALENVDSTPELNHLYPHDGAPEPLKIAVRGSGGFGDMLYMTSIIRALHKQFDQPHIFVFHTHSGGAHVFGQNPLVSSVLIDESHKLDRLVVESAAIDIFDLIVDVRYAVTYAAPPKSRVDPAFLNKADQLSRRWQPYVRRNWPVFNNRLATEAVALGLNQYSLLAMTSNLDLVEAERPDFFLSEGAHYRSDELLKLGAYITVHHGADATMVGLNGVQTKNLPDAHWKAIVAGLKAKGVKVVQLGSSTDPHIDDVDCDLRGACTFEQSAFVIRHTTVHVDTEGGLVHLARAMGTPSVVVFGPTSLPFFAYSANHNIAPKTCGDCWWTSERWASECPQGYSSALCMTDHDPDEIISATIAASRKPLMLSARLVRTEEGSWGADAPAAALSVAHVVDTAWARAHAEEYSLSTSTRVFEVISQGRGFSDVSIPNAVAATQYTIPAEPGQFDVVKLGIAMDDLPAVARLTLLCAQLVKPGGQVLVHTEFTPSQVMRAVADCLEHLPGARVAIASYGRNRAEKWDVAGAGLALAVSQQPNVPWKSGAGGIFERMLASATEAST